MWRAILSLLLVLLMADATGAAKRKKAKKKKAKAATKTEKVVRNDESEPDEAKLKAAKETEKKADEPVADAGNEMDIYRAIQKREEVTVQDLADLLLMYRGEFAKYKDAKARLARARELKLIQEHSAEEILDRGTLAYAIMKIYQPEQGMLYWLTGWERYALRDVQEAGIMPARNTPGQNLSGEQLLGTITAAEEFVAARSEWGKK